jgi:ParB-like nuclease domain/Recombinase
VTDSNEGFAEAPTGQHADESLRGIKTKVNGRRQGQRCGGIRFGVGPLAHLLKNRFYVGEVHYRGEVYRGEHEPILAHDLFKAVQEKLAANAVDRQVRLRGSAAIFTGRLFDDRGNRMSPTHANTKGVRYRYYVSHALLQNCKGESGSIARVLAPEVERLVCDGVRKQLVAMAFPPRTAARLAVDYVPIGRVAPDPRNARVHSRKQIRQIAASIETFGFNVPILIDADFNIIAGHGRLAACRHLGWTEVPAIRIDHLSEAQKRAFTIADNRLTEAALPEDAIAIFVERFMATPSRLSAVIVEHCPGSLRRNRVCPARQPVSLRDPGFLGSC